MLCVCGLPTNKFLNLDIEPDLVGLLNELIINISAV